jgi:hypothetical protein
MIQTANERFKQHAHLWQWIAGAVAIVAHVLVFVLTPAFEVEAVSGSRMVSTLGSWQQPRILTSPIHGYVPVDSSIAQPVLRNPQAVNHRIPRLYPWTLWHHREPGSALLEVSVSTSGRVREIRLLEREDTPAEAALLELVRLMRFEALQLPSGAAGLVGVLEVGVVPP